MAIRNIKFAILAIVLAVGCLFFVHESWSAPSSNDGTLQGVVRSSAGQPLSGAYVKLKNADRRLTIMVISGAQGVFTADQLPPGKYTLQGIGNGFQSTWSDPVDVANGKTAKMDLKLTAKQPGPLAPAWPSSGPPTTIPGKDGKDVEQAAPVFPEGNGKQIAESKCTVCHGAGQIVELRGDLSFWQHTISDMRENMKSMGAKDLTEQDADTLAHYFATVFPGQPAPDPNSRLSRTLLSGKEMKYRVVQYDVPRPFAGTHDIAVDPQGNGWVDERFLGGKLGRLDGKTLEYTEVAPPEQVRMANIEMAPDGKAWFMSRVGSGGCKWFSYDTKSGQWDVHTTPKDLVIRSCGGGAPPVSQHMEAAIGKDGVIYSGGYNQIVKMNFQTNQFSTYDVPSWLKTKQNVQIYGITISGDGALWFAESRGQAVGRLDPETGKIDEYKIPLDGVSFPRRMGADWDGNIWVGLWTAGKFMKVDQKTDKMTIFDPPTKDAGVYYPSADKKKDVMWVSLQTADRVDRYNPKTGEWLEFCLPDVESDVRKIMVDPSNPNRIWFAGNFSQRMGYIEYLGND